MQISEKFEILDAAYSNFQKLTTARQTGSWILRHDGGSIKDERA